MAFDSTYEERVAIMIIDGGLTEGEAEQAAHRICYHRTEQYQRKDGSIGFNHTLVAPKPPANQVAKQEEEQVVLNFDDFRAMARERFR